MKQTRPSIAFVTPMPPDRSGCADYSFATLVALKAKSDVTLVTETGSPRFPGGVSYAGRPQKLTYLDSRFDAVVSVLGNSHFHAREFDLLLKYGGACIAHDARMLDFYVHILGRERALAVASSEAGRAVTDQELDFWLANPGRLPIMFLSEIANISSVFMTHSRGTANIVKRLYKKDSTILPFVPYRTFS